MWDKYRVFDCRIILGQYDASCAVFRAGVASVEPHLSAGESPAARQASWLWSLSADVRRNGGPGRQRRISSRVPRWVWVATKVVSNKLWRCWIAVYHKRRRVVCGWVCRYWSGDVELAETQLTGAGWGHGSEINYQPFSRSFIWIWRVFLSLQTDFKCKLCFLSLDMVSRHLLVTCRQV